MSKLADDLVLLRHGPQPSRSDDEFVALVMAACDRAEAQPAPLARRRSWPWPAAATLLAAAAAFVLWPATDDPLRRPGGSVAARGPGLAANAPTVQAFVGRSGPDHLPAPLEGATLGPGDGIAVRYSNPTAREAFLMVFALDGRGDVHWLHPAYLSAAEDPRSLRLPPRTDLRLLDEVAEPEAPAPGLLRVYALLSQAPLSVKEVEARLQRGDGPVHQQFGEAEVEEWRCTWRAR